MPETPDAPEKKEGRYPSPLNRQGGAESRVGRRSARRVTPQSPHEALQPDAPPPPPPPSSRGGRSVRALSGLLSFLLVVALGAMFALAWSQAKLRAPGPLAESKVLYIAPGTEVSDIIDELDRAGIIDSPLFLNTALLIEGNRSKVKAGEYLFKQNASLRDVIDTLVSGKQVLHAVTIPEGLTSEQIVDRLREIDVLTGDVADVPKEGSLLPETYKVVRGTVRADLIKKMQDDQKRVVEQIWSRRASDLALGSPYEFIILASIVEKETGKADERPHVANVFLNRLRKRMRLQSDPTTVYGLIGGKGPLGRGLTRSEIDTPTPYNTYLIDGLPPGPIANPGRAALEAVANPSRTQDLYFVADGSGGHVFSETLDQHNRNVQRWRQLEKDTKDKEEQAAPDGEKPLPPPAPPVQRTGPRKSEHAVPPSVYGSLPAAASGQGEAKGQPASLSRMHASSAIENTVRDNGPRANTAAKPAAISAFAFGPGLDELGITLSGSAATAAAILDGPGVDDPSAPGAMTGAMFAGEAPSRETLTADVSQELPDQPAPPGGPALSQQPAVRRAFDASQGTPLDPLSNKTYDLNYAKTVPRLP